MGKAPFLAAGSSFHVPAGSGAALSSLHGDLLDSWLSRDPCAPCPARGHFPAVPRNNKLEGGSQISCQSLCSVWDTLAWKATSQTPSAGSCPVWGQKDTFTSVISLLMAGGDTGHREGFTGVPPSLAHSSCSHWNVFHALPLSSQPAIPRAIKTRAVQTLLRNGPAMSEGD